MILCTVAPANVPIISSGVSADKAAKSPSYKAAVASFACFSPASVPTKMRILTSLKKCSTDYMVIQLNIPPCISSVICSANLCGAFRRCVAWFWSFMMASISSGEYSVKTFSRFSISSSGVRIRYWYKLNGDVLSASNQMALPADLPNLSPWPLVSNGMVRPYASDWPVIFLIKYTPWLMLPSWSMPPNCRRQFSFLYSCSQSYDWHSW